MSAAPTAHGPLLVIIDMQRVFAQPGSPWYVPDFFTLVSPIERLRAAFGDRVVLTRFVVPHTPRGSWRDYYHHWSFIREPEAAPLLDLTAPWAGTALPVIEKPTLSAFGPALRARAGGDRTLVLCGVSTDACVLATALAAADAGMTVHIVADACAAVDTATHEGALHVARAAFAPIISVSTVAQELAWRVHDHGHAG